MTRSTMIHDPRERHDEVTGLRNLQIAECTLADPTKAWAWFEQPGLLRLSAVDATSFALMRR